MGKKINVKAIRAATGLVQGAFWRPLGVTQSGGSRYEAGRAMPKPLRILVAIAVSKSPDCKALIDKLRKPFKQ